MIKFKVIILTLIFSVFSMGSMSAMAGGYNDGMKNSKYSHHDKKHYKNMSYKNCMSVGQGESNAERMRDCREKKHEQKMKMKETWKEKHKRENSW